jgi:hypothetical protein
MSWLEGAFIWYPWFLDWSTQDSFRLQLARQCALRRARPCLLSKAFFHKGLSQILVGRALHDRHNTQHNKHNKHNKHTQTETTTMVQVPKLLDTEIDDRVNRVIRVGEITYTYLYGNNCWVACAHCGFVSLPYSNLNFLFDFRIRNSLFISSQLTCVFSTSLQFRNSHSKFAFEFRNPSQLFQDFEVIRFPGKAL